MSDGPVRKLVERVISLCELERETTEFSQERAEAWNRLFGEADALDARRWPGNEQAAEELARAVTAAHQFDRKMWGYPVRSWESYSTESQAEFVAQAAAVLRRLRGEVSA